MMGSRSSTFAHGASRRFGGRTGSVAGAEQEAAGVAVDVETVADDRSVVVDAPGGDDRQGGVGGDQGPDVRQHAVTPQEGGVAGVPDHVPAIVDRPGMLATATRGGADGDHPLLVDEEAPGEAC